MKTRVALVIALAWVASVLGAACIGEWRANRRQVLWYNQQWARTTNNAPGGFTFNIGNKNYEFGVRDDGVVVVREYQQSPERASGPTPGPINPHK